MKIIIEFDEDTSVFTAQFDRGITSSADGGPYPPPPPYNDQITAMTDWLAKSYPSIVEKFKDQEVSALKINFQAVKK
jgi:hypothetical protein